MNNNVAEINRCLKTPILIHESTSQEIPPNLQMLLNSLKEGQLTEADYLVMLAYTLMAETGFIPHHKIDGFRGMDKSPTFDIRYLTAAQTLPSKWKEDDRTYSLAFVLPSLPDNKVCMKAINVGCAVIITVWLSCKEDKPSWCIALEYGKYVLSIPTEFMSHIFFNLKELSKEFKNKISLPVRSHLKSTVTVEVCDLLSLPLEMIILITRYLRYRDIRCLSRTCKVLHTLLQ